MTSTARLLLDDEVLCIGELETVASPPDKLTGFRFGMRRVNELRVRAAHSPTSGGRDRGLPAA